MRHERLRSDRQQLRGEPAGATRIRGDFVLQETIEDLLGVFSVYRDELVPDLEWEVCRREPRARDRIDEEFSVVDVDPEIQARRKVRRHAIEVVRIIQTRDV